MVTILLASGSPRRRSLLEGIGLDVDVRPVDVDETCRLAEDARAYVRRMADDKLAAAEQRFGTSMPILVADTIVVRDGAVLGKPVDDRESASMVRSLLGRDHEVVTSVGVAGPEGRRLFDVHTRVTMRAGTEDEVARYVATGEGRDKAGAYAIQGIAGGFVTRIDGSYSNVVGLPLAESIEALRALGALGHWP